MTACLRQLPVNMQLPIKGPKINMNMRDISDFNIILFCTRMTMTKRKMPIISFKGVHVF